MKEELNDGPEIPDKSIASEETGRRNQMTAPRFQTGAQHQSRQVESNEGPKIPDRSMCSIRGDSKEELSDSPEIPDRSVAAENTGLPLDDRQMH